MEQVYDETKTNVGIVESNERIAADLRRFIEDQEEVSAFIRVDLRLIGFDSGVPSDLLC